MNATRVTAQPTPGGRRHLAFEPKVGALFLTASGRVCRLIKVKPEAGPRGDLVLSFLYCELDGTVAAQGALREGFEMHDGVAARLMRRIA